MSDQISKLAIVASLAVVIVAGCASGDSNERATPSEFRLERAYKQGYKDGLTVALGRAGARPIEVDRDDPTEAMPEPPFDSVCDNQTRC